MFVFVYLYSCIICCFSGIFFRSAILKLILRPSLLGSLGFDFFTFAINLEENGGEVPDKAADGAFIKRRLFQAQIHQFGMRDGSPVMHSPSRQDSAIRLRSLYHPVGVIS
ncbi:uncharacterized protein LOC120285498 isoform X2 [Drosophila simulans]|uniref:uncharacterized protein LOC120285498 isoform X2 n=1 Tax=Drosophila simulans TaxID=7240 RepID=UPI00192CFC63|nr:uncharacterized protein LOC120285498 isoform X2 [Drosophila simulans]